MNHYTKPRISMATVLAMVFFNLVSTVYCYSSGAPDAACNNLIPAGHDDPGDVGPPPFDITLSQSSFKPAESIQMTIHRDDGSTFKGFLIQARRTTGDVVEKIGSFVIESDNGKFGCLSSCTDWSECSITHENSNAKNTINITWTAPCTFQGDIVIRSTFVQSKTPSVYWADIEMATLIGEQGTGDECGQTTTAGTGGTGTSTTELTTTPMTPIDLSECGNNKGCFRSPPTCTDSQTCDYLLTWFPRGNQLDFEISALVTENDDRWISVGLSEDDQMGDDSVTDCIYNEATQTMTIQSSWNTNGPNNVPLDNTTLGIATGTSIGSYSNGVIQCRYTRWRDINSTNFKSSFATPDLMEDRIYNITEPYFLFLAKGAGSSGTKFPHVLVPGPLISPEKVDLNLVTDVNGSIQNRKLIVTHGVMMILAWMVFASIGVLMPRHFKPAWRKSMWFDKAIWFQIHRSFMTMVLLLTCCAFIIIFVEVGGYSKNLKNADAAHPVLGIIVTLLTIANPIMALFRPHPETPRRPIFNVAHFTVGRTAHITAGITMFLGTRLPSAGMSEWARWLVLFVIVWHGITELVLIVHQWYLDKNAKGTMTVSPSQTNLKFSLQKRYSSDSLDAPAVMASAPSNVELLDLSAAVESKEKSASIFKLIVIAIHFVVLLSCAIALMVELNTW